MVPKRFWFGMLPLLVWHAARSDTGGVVALRSRPPEHKAVVPEKERVPLPPRAPPGSLDAVAKFSASLPKGLIDGTLSSESEEEDDESEWEDYDPEELYLHLRDEHDLRVEAAKEQPYSPPRSDATHKAPSRRVRLATADQVGRALREASKRRKREAALGVPPPLEVLDSLRHETLGGD